MMNKFFGDDKEISFSGADETQIEIWNINQEPYFKVLTFFEICV